MKTFVIIGNVIALLGMSLHIISTFSTSKKTMLVLQTVMHALMVVSGLFFASYSGVVQDLTSMGRNLFVLSKKLSTALAWVFAAAGLIVGVMVNNYGLIGYLPVIASTGYAVLVITRPDVTTLKIGTAAAAFMWIFYCFAVQNYVSFAFNIATVISATVSVIIAYKSGKKQSNGGQDGSEQAND